MNITNVTNEATSKSYIKYHLWSVHEGVKHDC